MYRRAFTLVELLVVIAIIGLLSTVAVVATNSARVKTRDTKRVADIQQVQKALELYYAANGQYPQSGGTPLTNGGWSLSNDPNWAPLQTALAPYISSTIKDPIQSAAGWPTDGNTYSYAYFSLGYGCQLHWYMIVFQLENEDGKPDPGITACDGTIFRYGGNGSSTKIKTYGYRAT